MYHQYYYQYFCLFTSCCLLLGRLTGAEEEWMEDSLRQIHDKLYSKAANTLDPRQTLDLIKQMERFYSTRKDPGSLGKHEELKELIESSHINTRRCNRASFLLFQALLHSPTAKYPNIDLFLRHNRKLLFDVCEQILAFYLKDNVQDLTEDERSSAELIRESILPPKNVVNSKPFFYVPTHQIVGGLVRYIENKGLKTGIKVLDDEHLGKYYFHEEFMQSVGYVCKNVNRQLNPTVEVYDMFMDERYWTKNKDRYTDQWLTNTRLCREILDNLDQISDDVFQTFLNKCEERANRKHWYDPLVSCFRTIQENDDPPILA